jgi:large subunit ribosomal protein L25
MQHVAVQAERREKKLSKGQRRLLRDSGHVLASVYGRDTDAVSVTVPIEAIRDVLSAETGMNTLIDLTLDGQRHLARIAKVETDIYSRRLLHVGFQKIKATEPRKATIPVEITGEPEAVHNHTARMETGVREIEVMALPERLAPAVMLDISELAVGDVLRAGDIELPAGHELVTDPEMPLVSVKAGLTGIPVEEDEMVEATAPATESETGGDAGE